MQTDTRTLEAHFAIMKVEPNMRARFAEAQAVIDSALPGVLETYCDQLRAQPALTRGFGVGGLDAWKSAQLAHWRLLFAGDLGANYVSSAGRIGEIWARAKAEPSLVLGACANAIGALCETLVRREKKPGDAAGTVAAVSRALVLDAELTLAALRADSAATRRQSRTGFVADLENGMGATIEEIGEIAKELERDVAAVLRTADQARERAASVSAAALQTTSNLASVATAAEEMDSAVDEVARAISMSAAVAKNGASRAEVATQTFASLAAAAESIGQVVRLIADVAAKTNLLALNATIEAARAGEAGRGFAVVANEVKTLAVQTARATDDIGAKVREIQSVSAESVTAMAEIQRIISEIDMNTTSINAAAEEQRATTQEIARSTGEAAAGADGVSRNLGGVEESAGQTSAAVARIAERSVSLRQTTDRLREALAALVVRSEAA